MTNDQIELEFTRYKMLGERFIDSVDFGDFLKARHGTNFHLPDPDRSSEEYAAKLLDKGTDTIGFLYDDLEHSARFPRDDEHLAMIARSPRIMGEKCKQDMHRIVHSAGKVRSLSDTSGQRKLKISKGTNSES